VLILSVPDLLVSPIAAEVFPALKSGTMVLWLAAWATVPQMNEVFGATTGATRAEMVFSNLVGAWARCFLVQV